MGNTNSITNSNIKEKFGSIYNKDGITRPGYYWKKGKNKKLIYKGVDIPLLPDEDKFKSLKYGYLVTNKRVFYKGLPILQANPKSFSTITRDKINEFNTELKKLNSVLGMDYLGNKKRFYHKNNIVYEE